LPEGTTINGSVYLNILKDKLPQFLQIHQCTSFQQDGAPCHQTRAVKDWLQSNNISLIGPWPGNSPDLNPIEHCWVQVKRKVAAHNPTSLHALTEAIKTVWVKEITPEFCDRLCSSMPDRIQAVLKNKGQHSKY